MEIVTDLREPEQVLGRVADHGAVLLRPADRFSRAEFVALGDALMRPRSHGTALAEAREFVAGDATTTTVTRGRQGIPLHREASYVPGSPSLLMFYCERPAADGGETIVCDGVRLLAALPRATREFVTGAEIRWQLDMPDGSWQQMCGADDPAAAVAAITGYAPFLMPWESVAADAVGRTVRMRLSTRCVTPALFDGLPAFCNSVLVRTGGGDADDGRRLELRMADGTPFPAEVLGEVASVAEELTEPVPWQPGDVVVVNNTRVMHGRRGFADPARRILVRMGYLTPASVDRWWRAPAAPDRSPPVR
ncbi:TauD/TfdA family dioxygenase [Micromonospora sp. WMMD1102]|uniref:TauD/TfdA family dioxygenase n=1 Tax=Micromonospora sp. WMMD1102 TaxID=3016105 RepID=UPI002414E337|nr:TauD/TfdA family dioxygenase [Micromonospora sp. WMMD1102]MDG4788208.1 TauD/TfdA family dioxygenase [Micromonospora sp. WMMD1102]